MEDDAKLQKYHEDAVQGKFRHKRRSGGLALDESDSESDEDSKIRKKIHKKRRVEGDTLEDLGMCWTAVSECDLMPMSTVSCPLSHRREDASVLSWLSGRSE